MSATGSAGVLTFESPWVVNQSARAFRISSCSALSVFPTIRRTSQRLGHKGIRGGADTVAHRTVGVFRDGHHVGFQIVKRNDRTFIWLNNPFLLFVGLLPLTTALLGHHPFEQLTIVAYGLNLLAIQIFMFLTLWYATLHHHLVEAGLNDRFIWLARRRTLMGPAFSAAAILVSFLNPVLSLGAYVLYPVFFIVPGRIDRLWRRQEVR